MKVAAIIVIGLAVSLVIAVAVGKFIAYRERRDYASWRDGVS